MKKSAPFSRSFLLSAMMVAFAVAFGCSRAVNQQIAPQNGAVGEGVPAFQVRPGYRVTLAADGLQNARFLETDGQGTVFVSQPAPGSIIALRDRDGDGRYETRTVFLDGRRTVHGLCWRDGWLYFAQTGSIHRARDTDGDGRADDLETIIPEGSLPSGGGHWWRSLLVTEDAIYTSIGDSGNINDETATERQKIWKFDRKGGNRRLFASGIRNTEKLRLRPETQEIWGCDHGSDNFGRKFGEKPGSDQPVTDLNPPCEFNRYVDGGFYGHPFIVGTNLPRPEFQDRPGILRLAARAIPPEWCFGAHWAPNGFTFLTRDLFPDHRGDAFVAFHGSWNSTKLVGYCVERVLFDRVTGKPFGSLTVVSTLDRNGNVLARPVDCLEEPAGTVLFSCDLTNRIYRIAPDRR